jgi:hypothetical protein
MSPSFMNTPLTYSLTNVPFYKYIPVPILFLLNIQLHKGRNNDLLFQICSKYYICTYIHRCHIWHRNKFSRCQMDLLVSYSNDEHQTSLKWDRSSHPIAPECRVSHTLRLKMFTINVLRFCVSCSLRLNTPLNGRRGVMSDVDYPEGFPKTVIFFSKSTHSIFRCWLS